MVRTNTTLVRYSEFLCSWEPKNLQPNMINKRKGTIQWFLTRQLTSALCVIYGKRVFSLVTSFQY